MIKRADGHIYYCFGGEPHMSLCFSGVWGIDEHVVDLNLNFGVVIYTAWLANWWRQIISGFTYLVPSTAWTAIYSNLWHPASTSGATYWRGLVSCGRELHWMTGERADWVCMRLLTVRTHDHPTPSGGKVVAVLYIVPDVGTVTAAWSTWRVWCSQEEHTPHCSVT